MGALVIVIVTVIVPRPITKDYMFHFPTSEVVNFVLCCCHPQMGLAHWQQLRKGEVPTWGGLTWESLKGWDVYCMVGAWGCMGGARGVHGGCMGVAWQMWPCGPGWRRECLTLPHHPHLLHRPPMSIGTPWYGGCMPQAQQRHSRC